MSFYVPLSKKPALVLYHRDVIQIRSLSKHMKNNPLPGLSLLAVETPGRVHYLAFSNRDKMEEFAAKIKLAIFSDDASNKKSANGHGVGVGAGAGAGAGGGDGGDGENIDNSPAPPHHNAPSSDPRENFVLKSGQWAAANKSNRRVVLNARKMNFDGCSKLKASCFVEVEVAAEEEEEEAEEKGEEKEEKVKAKEKEKVGNTLDQVLSISAFVEKLLAQALSLSPESSLEDLIAFLNAAACLRSINLRAIDYTSEEAVCIFINLYHTLLQHALLLLGPPSKSSLAHFARCVCYEVGCDVFR